MGDILLACDTNEPTSDRKNQNTIKGILEKAGHTVTVLPVGPNHLQSTSKQGSSKGKIGVYMVNGADIGTYKDFADGIGSYYNIKFCYFALEGWISPSTCSCEGAKTVKLSKAWDDNYSSAGYTANVSGKTTAEVCQMYSDKIGYACGSSPEELGNNLVKVIGGGSSTGDEGASGANSGNVKECIQKLLTHWDGDVECIIRGKNMYIQQVRDPEETYSCSLIEGVNVFVDDISVTDLNPNTPNHLVVNWTGGSIEYKDELLIVRFGEHLKTMEAIKKVVTKVKKKSSDSDSEGSSSSSGSDSSSGSGTSSSGNEGTGDSTSDSASENANSEQIGNYTYYI